METVLVNNDTFTEGFARFWSKVHFGAEEGDCWRWLASLDRKGYGQFTFRHGLVVRAHRLAYELYYNTFIPDGLVLDHLCRNPVCVNPNHLEAVTQRENIRRGDSGKYQSRRTHCPAGHEYSDKNTYKWGGSRKCRACHSRQAREHLLRKKEENGYNNGG